MNNKDKKNTKDKTKDKFKNLGKIDDSDLPKVKGLTLEDLAKIGLELGIPMEMEEGASVRIKDKKKGKQKKEKQK